MRSVLFFLLIPLIVPAQINPVYVVKSNLNYTKLEASGDGMFGFEKDGKFGYIDKNEKVVIPAIYSYESTSSIIPSFNKGYVKIKTMGKYGLLDKTGKVVLPFEYEYINVLSTISNQATVGKKADSKTLYGLVTLQNQTVLPVEYEDIQADSNLIVIKKNGKWGLADKSGKQLIPFEFSSLLVYAKDKVLKAEKDNQYGYVDPAGKWLFEKAKTVYTLYGCYEGMIMCMVTSKYGFLDLKGNEAIITKYDYAYNFENNGLAKVGKKIPGLTYSYYYGYIDKQGNEVIPLKYESLGVFSDGLVPAKDPETNRYGYLDKTGKWIIKPTFLDGLGFDVFGGAWVKMTDGKYHYINKTGKDFGAFDNSSYKNFNKDGYAVFDPGNYSYALIDKTGKVITKIDDCDAIYNFSEGIAGYKCKSNGWYGFLDVNGNKIISCAYTSFTGFTDGVSKVDKMINTSTKHGYINNKGEIFLPIEYDTVQGYRNGWGLIKKNGNYYFVDKSGNLKEPPRKYDNLLEFMSGYALGIVNVTNNKSKTYYYINTQLKEEFNLTAIEAYSFWEDVAVVKRNDVYELMNKKGEVFKSLTGTDQLRFCSDGMLAVRQNGKWGFIDAKGYMVIPAKYDSCDSFKYGYCRIRNAGKWGIIDKSGKEIVEPKYENIVPGENDLFIFYDKAWGIMDKTGKILVQPTYYTITPFEKERALARLGKTYTIIKSPLAK